MSFDAYALDAVDRAGPALDFVRRPRPEELPAHFAMEVGYFVVTAPPTRVR